MTWRLKLLGPFDLTRSESPVTLSSSKLSGLLAYLAVADRPVQREEVAALLWGSHFDEQARQNIRQALVRLRKAVGPDLLISNDNTLSLDSSLLESDIADAERLARTGTVDALQAAANLLQGGFLAGIDIREPLFEEWLTRERHRFSELSADVLVNLAALELEAGRASEALARATACISRNEFREDAHRLVMKALAALGRRAEAVRHYQDLAARLKQELDTTPEPLTAATMEEIRATGPAPAPTSPSPPAPQAGKKPTIAVLPFVNLSNDPEQEFMAEGISEDLITEISKFRSLFVISRNSSFSYKGGTVGPKEISAKLGVRYLVDGSVRRAGNRLRITAKLIDAAEDQTLWAEHYDRQLEDIFEIQDEVVRAIVSAIEPQLISNERNRALRKPPENLDAWEAYQRGLWQMFRYHRDERDQALALFRRAIALDPRFASAHAGLALALYVYVLLDSTPDRAVDIAESIAEASMAIELDEFDPLGYASLTRCLIVTGKSDEGVVAADKAIRLNPSFAMAHFGRGHALWHLGQSRDAIMSLDEAIRLSPLDPVTWAFMASRAIALMMDGEFEQAIDWSRRAQQQNNAAIFAHVGELTGLGHLKRQDEAADAVRRAIAKMPDVCVSFFDRVLPVTSPPHRDMLLDGLRQAGLPE